MVKVCLPHCWGWGALVPICLPPCRPPAPQHHAGHRAGTQGRFVGQRREEGHVRAGVWPDPLPALPPVPQADPPGSCVEATGAPSVSTIKSVPGIQPVNHHQEMQCLASASCPLRIPWRGGGGVGRLARAGLIAQMRKHTEPTSSSQAGQPKSRGRDTRNSRGSQGRDSSKSSDRGCL